MSHARSRRSRRAGAAVLAGALLLAPMSASAATGAAPVAPVAAPLPEPAAGLVAEPVVASADDAAITVTPVGTHETGVFDQSAAEIVAHDAATQRLFVVNAAAGSVDVLAVGDPTAPVPDGALLGGGVEAADGSVVDADAIANSVDIRTTDGLGAVALEAGTKTDDGWVVFFDARADTVTTLGAVRVGALPDMLTFTPDGERLVVAIEGEPSEDFTVDPEGSVAVIDVPAELAAPGQDDVAVADFRAFDPDGDLELPEGVRVFGPELDPERPVSTNLEPEYVSVTDDSGTAYVGLQEANAVAVVDLDTAAVTEIFPLGTKDHSVEGAGMDPSDRDGPDGGPLVNIRPVPVQGLSMPDGIDLYTAGGESYLVTANEGDAREWGDYVESVRVKDLGEDDTPALCESVDPALAEDAELGRLNVSIASGLSADGCIEELHSFGARSFSIWTTDGEQVFDSGDDFEQLTAEALPDYFNSNHSETNLEGRSEDKGPEPEDVTIGAVGDRTYVFIGLERLGGVMVYDVTQPAESRFVTYVNNRDFSVSVEDADDPDAALAQAGDLGTEGLTFIAAEDSPVEGTPMLAVANEVSGTTTLFAIEPTDDEPAPGTTTIDVLAVNDFHGRLEANGQEAGAAVLAGAVDAFEAANPNTIFTSAGDNIGASTFVSFVQDDEPTIDALNAAGLEVASVGNHEFDKGFDDLTDRVVPRADFSHLGANVYGPDGEPALPEYEVVERDGVRVGFIGAVTEDLPSLVSPAGIEGLEVGSVVEALDRVSAQLSDGDDSNGEADVVVALVHEGAASTTLESATTGEFGAIAVDTSADVDAIVSAHTHQTYAHAVPVDGLPYDRPVVQAGQYGYALSHLSIDVDDATGEVLDVAGEVVPLTEEVDEEWVPLFDPDPEVQAIVDDAVLVADELGKVSVGSIAADINRAVQSDGSENRGGESTLGNLVADVQLDATSAENVGGAQIAFMNPGGLREDLTFASSGADDPDGNLTFAEAAAVQPFANTLVTLTLTGEQIRSVLEEQWQPEGSSRPFLKLGVSAGLTYTYDAELPAGERITSMTFEGEPVDLDADYRVAANSFLASGGDNFFTLAEGTDVADSGQVDLEAFVTYAAEVGEITPDYAQRAVGLQWVSDPDAVYAAGDEIALEASSLLFSTTEPKDEVVQATLAGQPVGEFPIDPAVVDTTDEVGRASIAVTVPKDVELPDGAAAAPAPTTLVLSLPDTGTEVVVPITLDVEAGVGDDDGTGEDGVADDGVADDGVADDGVADDGVADDGVADDGTGDNGTGADGTGDDDLPDTGGAGLGLLLLGGLAGLAGGAGVLARRRLS